MTKILSLSCLFALVLTASGCRNASEPKATGPNLSAASVQPSKTPAAAPVFAQTLPIDLAKLADKSPAELDKIFGPPQDSSRIENGGEFRLYKIAGHSKGLAVRFYDGRAKGFNLILDAPVETSKEAVRRVFNIDVGKSAPKRHINEPLSEVYEGAFGGVKFKKVSAKKQAEGRGFIFVLAEVSE